MIESITLYLSMHSDQAPLFVFGLLLLTGFSLPVSEDVIVIASGVLAATVIKDQIASLFIAVYTGCLLSDWIAYWIGRLIGHQLIRLPIFRNAFKVSRLKTAQGFFQRYKFLTLFVSRMIPFGMRNSVFMAAGAGKMRFTHFLLVDAISCLLFSGAIFYLSFQAGENYATLHSTLSSIGLLTLSIVITFAVAGCAWIWLYPSNLKNRIVDEEHKAIETGV